MMDSRDRRSTATQRQPAERDQKQPQQAQAELIQLTEADFGDVDAVNENGTAVDFGLHQSEQRHHQTRLRVKANGNDKLDKRAKTATTEGNERSNLASSRAAADADLLTRAHVARNTAQHQRKLRTVSEIITQWLLRGRSIRRIASGSACLSLRLSKRMAPCSGHAAGSLSSRMR
jgi:hypothetical protein